MPQVCGVVVCTNETNIWVFLQVSSHAIVAWHHHRTTSIALCADTIPDPGLELADIRRTNSCSGFDATLYLSDATVRVTQPKTRTIAPPRCLQAKSTPH